MTFIMSGSCFYSRLIYDIFFDRQILFFFFTLKLDFVPIAGGQCYGLDCDKDMGCGGCVLL